MTTTTWQHIPESDSPSFPTTQAQEGPTTRIVGGHLTLTSGEMTESATLRVNSDDCRIKGAGILDTAQNNGGFHTTNITPESTVIIPGFGRTTVKVAEHLGYIQKGSNGQYVEARNLGKSVESPQGGSRGDSAKESQGLGSIQGQAESVELFGPASEKAYSDFIAPVPQGTYDSILASANALISDGGDSSSIAASLAPRLAQSMGIEPAKAREMLQVGASIWQKQADAKVSSFGADPEDFFTWAKTYRKDELQNAVNNHLFGRSTKGYADLMDDYFRSTEPTEEAIKAAGIPTKRDAGQLMVKIKGHWMTVGAAVQSRYL